MWLLCFFICGRLDLIWVLQASLHVSLVVGYGAIMYFIDIEKYFLLVWDNLLALRISWIGMKTNNSLKKRDG